MYIHISYIYIYIYIYRCIIDDTPTASITGGLAQHSARAQSGSTGVTARARERGSEGARERGSEGASPSGQTRRRLPCRRAAASCSARQPARPWPWCCRSCPYSLSSGRRPPARASECTAISADGAGEETRAGGAGDETMAGSDLPEGANAQRHDAHGLALEEAR